MKNNSHSDTTIPKHAGKFTVARQVDIDVKSKVDRHAFQEAAQLVELPTVITDLEFVFITLICQATDNGKNEIWENEGGAYISLTLPYQFAAVHSEAEVTQRFLKVYENFISQVVQVPHISNLE